MKVITRQFAKDVLFSSAFVLVALVALFAFFELINNLDDVGENFTLGTAFLLTALTMPSRIYEVMPLAVLLASVYTMSRWASTSEFTVLRVAGMSPMMLAKALVIPGILMVALTYIFGEVVAPAAARYEVAVKSGEDSSVSARGYASGVWVRDVTTNEAGKSVDRYINVKNLSASNIRSTGAWRMFEFDAQGRMLRFVRAESAMFEPGRGWLLKHAIVVSYPDIDPSNNAPTAKRIETEKADELFFSSTIVPEILGVMTTKPDDMSMRDLKRYLDHLAATHQSAGNYEVVFWTKVFYPLAVIVMLALSMPFAYLNARSGGVALKIFGGVMIGVAFYALNNLFSYLGIVNTWSPAITALMPSAAMLLIAAWALYWVERR